MAQENMQKCAVFHIKVLQDVFISLTIVHIHCCALTETWKNKFLFNMMCEEVKCVLRVCAVPCNYTSPFDLRRHTLLSPGRRSGCPTRRRYTRTGCTVGNINAKLLLSTVQQAERGATRVCPSFMLHQTIKVSLQNENVAHYLLTLKHQWSSDER